MGGILWQLPLHGEEGIALQEDRILQEYSVALAEIAEPVLVETGRDRFAVRRRPGLVEECPGVSTRCGANRRGARLPACWRKQQRACGF